MNSRVLVVDDDREVRLLARVILERRGYEVDEAESAEATLAIIERRVPDVVIVDHDLGDGTSGLELASMISRLSTPMHVIMFSANLVDGSRHDGVEAVINKANFRTLADQLTHLPDLH
jgi:DNA-binding NtrC family response regulator